MLTSIRGKNDGAFFKARAQLVWNPKTLNANCFADLAIQLNQYGAEDGWPRSHFEAARHLSQKLLDRMFFFDPDHRLNRTGHSDISDVGGPFGQNLFICGLNMCMSADHRRHLPV